jgi:histidyl-tRNA synthetase
MQPKPTAEADSRQPTADSRQPTADSHHATLRLMATPQHKSQSGRFQAPRGMRDFYPADMAVRRYIEGVWREVSINHGFEEIEGPMFEHTELYTHKSGPGIVSELFQVFSGKDEAEIEQIRRGKDAPYALRPEFTPTLARMVAARAAQLPKPIKWFAIPAHFRAERPQRGRLREFMQWNVDFIGGEVDPAKADAEVIAVAVAALETLGLDPSHIRVNLSDRFLVDEALQFLGVPSSKWDEAYAIFDRRAKLPAEEFQQQLQHLGLDAEGISHLERFFMLKGDIQSEWLEQTNVTVNGEDSTSVMVADRFGTLLNGLEASGVSEWCELDLSIVRGLAYYTGTVFEIIAEGERAVAGGGRYDNSSSPSAGRPCPRAASAWAMSSSAFSCTKRVCCPKMCTCATCVRTRL